LADPQGLPAQQIEIGPQLVDLPPWMIKMFGQLGATHEDIQKLTGMLIPVPNFGVGVTQIQGRAAAQLQGQAMMLDLSLFQNSSRVMLAPPGKAQAQMALSETMGAQSLGFLFLVVQKEKLDEDRVEEFSAVADHRRQELDLDTPLVDLAQLLQKPSEA
jgi:hypothetical protein